jgi:ferredoxin-like protein FixX
MRKDGTFIAVEVDEQRTADAELARRLTEACPVDIFSQGDGSSLQIVEKNLDECVLCRLCLDAAERAGAPGAVKIIKLYDNDAVLA